MTDGCRLPPIDSGTPAKALVATGLNALGLQGRTVEERKEIAKIYKRLSGKGKVHDLCDKDFPKVFESAKEKLEALRHKRVLDAIRELERKSQPDSQSRGVGGGVYSLTEVQELLGIIAASSVVDEDLPQLQVEVPKILRRFKPPGKRRLGLEDIALLASRLDERADQLRFDREQELQILQGPVRVPPAVKRRTDIDKVDARTGPFARYLEVCQVPTPEPIDLTVFVHLLPRGKDSQSNSMRRDRLGKSQSLPQLKKSPSVGTESTLRSTGHQVALQMSTGTLKKVSFVP